ncbi:hypothetical protein E3N88_04516 [Mikania micrantha]|uniref:Uncharacterized protein n=1 Tax=Mikania micrantha TaxID=192012 RepID=A0A5N6PWT1_9ASTR|nr:hypothetical protein E3N88_04516 [Mikania micrantha]
MAPSTWSTNNQLKGGSSNPDAIAAHLTTILSQFKSFEKEAIIAQLASIRARLNFLRDDVAVIKVWMDDKELDDAPQDTLTDLVMEVYNSGSSMSKVARVPKNYA